MILLMKQKTIYLIKTCRKTKRILQVFYKFSTITFVTNKAWENNYAFKGLMLLYFAAFAFTA